MVGAAIFGAEQVEGAGLRRFEPGLDVAARQHVLFDAEFWHEEAVDHVLAGHHQPHRHADGNVERIDFARAVGMLKLPHPLLGDDVDFHRILRHVELLGVERGGEPEHEDEDEQGGDRPADLDLARQFLGHRPPLGR